MITEITIPASSVFIYNGASTTIYGKTKITGTQDIDKINKSSFVTNLNDKLDNRYVV